uniref:Uncharacterized protein n=1 Tax=Rhizophora mucronata TaxID=61149 RepID=A0A2P2Q202_RHIMU
MCLIYNLFMDLNHLTQQLMLLG